MKRVLILGFGISAISAYDYLLKKGYAPEFANNKYLEKDININGDDLDRLFCGLSFIVVSPGISLDINLIKEAKIRKIKIVGEFELGASEIESKIIAITGTNGKTTTTSLIYHLLKDYDKKSYIGGNIGLPVTKFSADTKSDDVVVLECSSFQLETVYKFKAKIGIILNVTPDHLNRHKTMKKYFNCKLKITKNQDENDFLILNADSEFLMKNLPKTKAKILFFSTQKKVNGCYIKRGNIYYNIEGREEKLINIKNIKLVGEHNLSNVLAACLAVKIITANNQLIKGVSSFCGVSHRLEFVTAINGVQFFNDSKATNIDSTLVACKSFKNGVNLILGGSDKGYDFDKLFANLPKNIKNIAIFGQTKQKIAFSAKKYKYKNFKIFDTLSDATKYCFSVSNIGEVVLLSPACASFDCFSNFEERGNVFKKIVEEIAECEKFFTKTKT